MMKYELEERLGFEITQEGFEVLNNMYMACDLDKDAFAKLVKAGAKDYKYVKPVRMVRLDDEYSYYGGRYIVVAEYVGCNIKSGKTIVKNVKKYSDYTQYEEISKLDLNHMDRLHNWQGIEIR